MNSIQCSSDEYKPRLHTIRIPNDGSMPTNIPNTTRMTADSRQQTATLNHGPVGQDEKETKKNNTKTHGIHVLKETLPSSTILECLLHVSNYRIYHLDECFQPSMSFDFTNGDGESGLLVGVVWCEGVGMLLL